MNIVCYETEAFRQLKDKMTYQELKMNLTDKILQNYNNLIAKYLKPGAINMEQYKFLSWPHTTPSRWWPINRTIFPLGKVPDIGPIHLSCWEQ